MEPGPSPAVAGKRAAAESAMILPAMKNSRVAKSKEEPRLRAELEILARMFHSTSRAGRRIPAATTMSEPIALVLARLPEASGLTNSNSVKTLLVLRVWSLFLCAHLEALR